MNLNINTLTNILGVLVAAAGSLSATNVINPQIGTLITAIGTSVLAYFTGKPASTPATPADSSSTPAS